MSTEPPQGPFSRWRDAALSAEYRTGDREDTEEEARRNIFLRIGIIVSGSIVLLAGMAMLVLPGPGVVAMLAGLGILAQELPWAERMMDKLKERTKVDQVRTQPAWVQAVMVVATITGVGASIAYAVMRWA